MFSIVFPAFYLRRCAGRGRQFFTDPVGLLRLVSRGDLIIDPEFVLARELSGVVALATKYADRPMDLADACLVRMTELSSRSRVWTVDRDDFTVYRRNGRQPIACEFPPLGG